MRIIQARSSKEPKIYLQSLWLDRSYFKQMLEQWKRKIQWKSATIAINMVIGLMNAKRNQNLKVNVTNAKSMDTSHQNAKPRY